MTLKKIVILSLTEKTKNNLSKYLGNLLDPFPNTVEIQGYTYEEINKKASIVADLVLFAGTQTQDLCKDLIRKETPTLLCDRVVDYKRIHEILYIPPKSSIFIVNSVKEYALSTIEQFYKLGLNQYNFIHFCEGNQNYPNVKYALSFGNGDLLKQLPAQVEKIIDIGPRIISSVTINEIIHLLNLPLSISNEVITQHLTDLMSIIKASNHQIRWLSENKDVNQSTIVSLIPPHNSSVIATRKYTFNDYLSIEDDVIAMIEIAKRIALKDSDVLIHGESGTGKEIIAQAIHNYSKRNGENFVPVNFTTMQQNLIESELFGYEEGSFTGAKKGGKKGLFEMANNGTVFIDEIGDAPLRFQAQLLRVLQERKIRKVGSTQEIPINVRVIVATHKPLGKMIRENKFRVDLYYRINVMPINTIPLRHRKNDLILIFSTYLKKFFDDRTITINSICSDDLIEFLMEYTWPGNIRELMNLCEYFSCIKLSAKLTIADLPKYMFENLYSDKTSFSSLETEILKIIDRHPKAGRNHILSLLQERKFVVTEGQVRSLLRALAEKGLIKVNKTKGGCTITEMGQLAIGN